MRYIYIAYGLVALIEHLLTQSFVNYKYLGECFYLLEFPAPTFKIFDSGVM